MAFAAVYRTYTGCSSRRFASDLRDAEEKGLIEKAPNFNTLLTYLRYPSMTETPTAMLEVSSLPMRAVETQFAADSSGFGTSNLRHEHPHRDRRRRHSKRRQRRPDVAPCFSIASADTSCTLGKFPAVVARSSGSVVLHEAWP